MDIREYLFGDLDREYDFGIVVTQKGIFAGREKLLHTAKDMELRDIWIEEEGKLLSEQTMVFRAYGNPFQVTQAEEKLLGLIGKPSGVATSSRNFVESVGGRIKIVCGAWKKVFPEIKDDLRKAIAIGGAGMRITDEPFVYLDKNYVRMLGGVSQAVKKAASILGKTVVVQLRGEDQPIVDEAQEAVEMGAGIIMVDTGNIADLREVVRVGVSNCWRNQIKIAFAGGVNQKELEALIEAGADIVDVGRSIIDAPLLDFRLDVIK